MPTDESMAELTLTGVGSGEQRALSLAVGDVSHDFGLRTTIDVTDVTGEKVTDLLDALAAVEQEMSECGAYDDAESASRMYGAVKRAAREERLISW